MPWSDAEFVPEDPNRAKLEQYYEREKLKKLYGSAVSHDGTAFVATVSVRKPVYGAAASSWADIAEQHEGRAAAADGGDEPRRKRSRSADKQKKKKRKKEGKRHKKKKHKKERQRGGSGGTGGLRSGAIFWSTSSRRSSFRSNRLRKFLLCW